jgi:hypothetical protein
MIIIMSIYLIAFFIWWFEIHKRLIKGWLFSYIIYVIFLPLGYLIYLIKNIYDYFSKKFK